MLISKILKKKREITNKLGVLMSDLIYGTFKFPTSGNSGVIVVNEYENMRPDLVCNRIYANDSHWDSLLKYNGISNPFSIQTGDVIFAPPYNALEGAYINPRNISEREQKTESDVSGILNKETKDSNRAKNLSSRKGDLPPNINKVGNKNVKVKDGKLIFGEDVTSVNRENCPIPISRARLIEALIKDKLF